MKWKMKWCADAQNTHVCFIYILMCLSAKKEISEMIALLLKMKNKIGPFLELANKKWSFKVESRSIINSGPVYSDAAAKIGQNSFFNICQHFGRSKKAEKSELKKSGTFLVWRENEMAIVTRTHPCIVVVLQ